MTWIVSARRSPPSITRYRRGHVHRRDLLRWSAYLAAAGAIGCRPDPGRSGEVVEVAGPKPPPPAEPARPPPSGPLEPRDGLDPRDFAAPDDLDDEVDDEPTDEEPPAEQASQDEGPATEETGEDDDAGEDPATEADDSDSDEEVNEDTEDSDEEPDAPITRRVEVICRDALGLAAATSGGASHAIGRLTLHHTQVVLGENRNAPGRLRSHQQYHQEQGWVDIAYHFGVDLNGNLYELRDPNIAGETFTEYDPAGHFLVVCEGDYNTEVPSDAMLQATAEILAYGARRFGIGADTLTGHRDHAAVTCPGDHLYARLGELGRETARLAGQTVEYAPLCGEAGRQKVEAIETG
jgi:hypothetical protein